VTTRSPEPPGSGRSAKRPAGRAARRSARSSRSTSPHPDQPTTGAVPPQDPAGDPSRPSGSTAPSRGGGRPRRPIRLISTPFRLWSAFCVVAFVLSLFAARLVQLQGVDEEDYAQLAVQMGSQTITLEAPRAPIYDRNGVELAETVDASKLIADPTYTSAHATQIAAFLHRTLGLDYLTMVGDLRKPDTRYVELADHVTPTKATSTVDRLNAMGLGGIYTQHDTQRMYPGGDVAANIVGFLNGNNAGVYGIENADNSTLQGTNGRATYQVVGGQILPLASSSVVEPREGTGVRLTIDQDLQFLAERHLAAAVQSSRADSGVAIVMDARTSQVLAMADYPTFDANHPATTKESNYGSRALQDAYEPGSVEKLLTFSALINAGYVTPTTKIVEPQVLYVGGHYIHDDFTHVDADGVPTNALHLTAAGVIAKSSNIGAVIAAEKMPDAELYGYLKKFGIGSPLNVGMPEVNQGLLAPPKDWSEVQRANIDFGQGVSVDALQMAAAVSAIAHGGVYTDPTLVQGTVSSSGQFTPSAAPAQHRVVTAATAHAVARMMQTVVAEGGTAPLAAIPGYEVAGKTGTAQRAAPNGGGYTNQRTVSFAGFAPADNPRFVIYVVVQNPRAANSFGGTVAAPVFQELMTAALQKYGVPPSTGKQPPLPPITW
jgi:cell division protein FtsI (penicillin-binding protein 3)